MTGTGSITSFETAEAAAVALRDWASAVSGPVSGVSLDDLNRLALAADLRGVAALLVAEGEPPDEGMTPLRAAQAAVVRVLRRSGVEYPDLDTLALRAARVVLDPGAPAGSVVAGMQSAYSDGIRATANYVRQHGSPGEGISAADAERMWGGLAAMETRAEALANRKR